MLSNKINADETKFPYKLLLTKKQISNLCEPFENHLFTNTKLLKTQLPKLFQVDVLIKTLYHY